MTQVETTLTAGEIVDELDERLDEIARERRSAQEDADDADSPGAVDDAKATIAKLDRQGTTVEERLTAFEDVVDEHGADAEFAIAKLSADDRMRFGDLLEAAREQAQERRGFEAGSNMRDVFWAAAGVVDAPWLDGDEEMFERTAAMRNEETGPDWHVIQYLKEQVTEVNSQGNPERKSYAERVAARQPQNEPN